jgi:hypothetical protein
MTGDFIRKFPRSLGFLIVYYCEQRPRLRRFGFWIWRSFLLKSMPNPHREREE